MGGFLTSWFANPALLMGLAAAAIPFILHLVYRRRAPKILFSTLRFIRASAERTARRRRIRDWLLLLLRAAVIFFLVTALAGPIFRSVGSGGSVTVALVMDNSYSMAAEWEQTSAYARARDYAVRMLGELSADSQVAVTYVCPFPGRVSLADRLTSDRNGLADEISRSEVSAVSGDMAGAIMRAEKLLDKSPFGEIYVFTDMQRAGWRALAEQGAVHRPTLIVVECGAGERENVVVSDVACAALRPAVGVPLTLKARARNFSARQKEGKAVLYVEGKREAERTVKVGSGAEAEVSFALTFKEAGTHSGWVQIEVDDVLALDNRRYFAIDTPAQLRVGVVREKEGAVAQLDDAFFIVPALNPSAAGLQVSSAIAPERLLRSALTQKDLTSYAVMFLVNVAYLDSAQLRAVAGYLAAGGSVVIFPGDDLKPDAWNEFFDSTVESERELMPARFGELLPVEADSAGAMRLDGESVDFEHLVFLPFARTERSFFNDVVASRYYDLVLPEASGARVLARLENGKPFLVEKGVGEGGGKVMLFCTTATTRWTNLPARRLFLPLLHQVTYYLARTRRVGGAVVPGRPVRFPGVKAVAADGEVRAAIEITDPMGTTSAASLKQGGSEWVFPMYSATARPGVYSWRDRNDESRRGEFVVNLNTAEGDLTVLSREELAEKMLAGRAAHFARSADEARVMAQRLREGVRLRTPLLFFVIAVLLIECLMANPGSRKDKFVRGAGG